jgi:hypothetical protein
MIGAHKRKAGIADQVSLKPQVAGHANRRFQGIVRADAGDDQGIQALRAQR